MHIQINEFVKRDLCKVFFRELALGARSPRMVFENYTLLTYLNGLIARTMIPFHHKHFISLQKLIKNCDFGLKLTATKNKF